MKVERTGRGQLADTWHWAEGAGMGLGQERGWEIGEGSMDGDRLPSLQPLHLTSPSPHGQVQPCTRSVHPAPCPWQHLPGQCQHLDFGTSGSEGVGTGLPRDTQSSRSHLSPSRAWRAQHSGTQMHRHGSQLAPSPQRAEPSTGGSHRSAGGTERILC